MESLGEKALQILFALTSAPFCRSNLTTGSLSGTLAEIMSGVQPMSSYIAHERQSAA